MDLIREQLHRQRLSSDPLYRHDYLQNLDPRKADKMLNGTILKTFDGGLNWTPEKQSASEGYDAIFFADENNGWVIGETYVPSTQSDIVAVYHTTDGGDTWNPVTNLPATITGTQGWYPSGVKFVNPQFGIMYGIASKGFGYAPAFLYTEDGGANWTVDKSALSLHGGEFDISFASPHVAYAVGLYLDLLRYESANAKPVANAGADFQTDLNVQASLDGSGSSDADGDTLKYAWTQVSGPTITLSDATAVKPTFTPTEAGDAQFQLVVNDGTEDSDPATVTVTIAPAGTDDDTTSGDDDSSPAGDDDNGDNSSGCGC
jgi:hypothetical protein